jgi:TctA family transporter
LTGHLALWLGLQIAACGTNLLYCLIGVHLGTAIGVLPGPRSSGDDCDALSVTFRAAADIRADHAFWHHYDAQYGGSTAAILGPSATVD